MTGPTPELGPVGATVGVAEASGWGHRVVPAGRLGPTAIPVAPLVSLAGTGGESEISIPGSTQPAGVGGTGTKFVPGNGWPGEPTPDVPPVGVLPVVAVVAGWAAGATTT